MKILPNYFLKSNNNQTKICLVKNNFVQINYKSGDVTSYYY